MWRCFRKSNGVLHTGIAVALLLLSSCMFRTTRKTIRTIPITPGATVQFISEDSVRLLFDRATYFETLKADSSIRAEVKRLELLFPGSIVSIDSICNKAIDPEVFFRSNDFIITRLNEGKAMLTDLHTGKTIRRYKRKTRYVNPGLFHKGDLVSVSYSIAKGETEIYFKRYRTIHF